MKKYNSTQHHIQAPPPPPPPPPPSPSSSTARGNWRKKQKESDLLEKELKFAKNSVNNAHWKPTEDFHSLEWSTINDFSDLKFRISCLLESNIKPSELLISFDFDGTLGARRSKMSIGRDKTSIEAVQDTYIEEGKTVELLHNLNNLGIPFFVNTAAPNPCRARETMKKRQYRWEDVDHYRPEMPMSSFLIEKGMEPELEKSVDYYGQKIKQCGHVLSALYEKHVPIDYIIDKFKLDTKVILHVDDGLINIKTVLDRGFKSNVIGMYFPTEEGTIIGYEPGFDMSYNHIKDYEVPARHCKPFESKVAAKRYFESKGVKLVKGDSVKYMCKGELRSTWY